MARIFAYSDSPTAHTGFGRSALHVLRALHAAGHTIVQLAVNHDPSTEGEIPWKVYSPTNRDQDPYGLRELPNVVLSEDPFDIFWTTFDPEIPWAYVVPGCEPQVTVLQLVTSLRQSNPGLKTLGWFPIDGGPLSDYELAILGSPEQFDVVATMSPHVHDLVAWTLKLKKQPAAMDEIRKRIQVVPHGIDLGLYRIASDEERREAKASLGFDPDRFLLIQVERNQQRKQPWLGLALLEALKVRHPNVALWQHMDEDEETLGCHAGFRLRDLSWRYGLEADVDVRWRDRPYSEAEMIDTVYAAGDVLVSTSLGEGFQYPAWEALSCGRRVVLPADSARRAWLANTPGAFLYKTDPHGQVVRGGYNRRMGAPDIGDAARIVAKMAEGKQKFQECGEASRSWVESRASLDKVEQWWVKAVAEQVEAVGAERLAMGVRIMGEEKTDYVVEVRANPGMGDVVLMAPALKAFKAKAAAEGKTVTLALPTAGSYLQLAQWLEIADFYHCHPKVAVESIGNEVLSISSLWKPTHRMGWSEPRKHRTDVVAEFLGVEGLAKIQVASKPETAKQHSAQFQERFGVHPSACVAICPQSGSPHRAVPEGIVKQVVERVLTRGLTPILIGGERMDVQRVGAIDLTAGTDFATLAVLLGQVGAVIATDSGPLHLAAVQGTPLVGLFPTFSAAARIGYYAGPIVTVEPGVSNIGAEEWPPGKAPRSAPGAWAGLITAARIIEALDELLSDDTSEGDLAGIGAPKVVTAADLGLEGAENDA